MEITHALANLLSIEYLIFLGNGCVIDDIGLAIFYKSLKQIIKCIRAQDCHELHLLSLTIHPKVNTS